MFLLNYRLFLAKNLLSKHSGVGLENPKIGKDGAWVYNIAEKGLTEELLVGLVDLEDLQFQIKDRCALFAAKSALYTTLNIF